MLYTELSSWTPGNDKTTSYKMVIEFANRRFRVHARYLRLYDVWQVVLENRHTAVPINLYGTVYMPMEPFPAPEITDLVERILIFKWTPNDEQTSRISLHSA